MKSFHHQYSIYRKGFSAAELIVIIALSALIFTLTYTTFASFSNMQALEKDTDVMISYIQKARNQTINSRNGNEYGVRFASTSVTLFEGTVYSASATTSQVYTFSPKTQLSAISLTGGTTSVYFEQLTGKPSATGTILFYSKANASTTRRIYLYGSGLTEIQ